MAAANHVQALVHATGATMTWARQFYSAYRFELSQNPAEDMTIDNVVDLTGGNARATITFIDVLRAILDAANAGYLELMIVAHGNADGLIMPMGPGLGSANKQGLPLMTVLAGVVRERDRIQAIADPRQQLTEWRSLLTRMSGSATAGATWGTITADQIRAIGSAADAESWLETMSPTVRGHSMLANSTILTLLSLRNQVARKNLRRVEIRACNLGQDADGMTALREFLGAAKVVAPIVKTFYARVTPTTFTSDSLYRTWLTRNTPWLLRGGSDPGNTRTYLGDSLFRRLNDSEPTPMAVLKLFQPSFQTCASIGAASLPYRAVKVLIDTNFDVKRNLRYQSGPFYVGGLDPVAGRTRSNPPPAAAHGKAFVVASEPEYRSLIVANP